MLFGMANIGVLFRIHRLFLFAKKGLPDFLGLCCEAL